MILIRFFSVIFGVAHHSDWTVMIVFTDFVGVQADWYRPFRVNSIRKFHWTDDAYKLWDMQLKTIELVIVR